MSKFNFFFVLATALLMLIAGSYSLAQGMRGGMTGGGTGRGAGIGGMASALEPDETIASLRAAAEQGDAQTQYRLGIIYETGQDVAQDHAEAARWLHMAAERGNAPAQNSLGGMYTVGLGVTRDHAEAYAWLSTAAAQGQSRAEEVRPSLLEEMTPSQIERAEALAREYQEKYVAH